eukprot:4641082-Prymnesium_polylepis.1
MCDTRVRTTHVSRHEPAETADRGVRLYSCQLTALTSQLYYHCIRATAFAYSCTVYSCSYELSTYCYSQTGIRITGLRSQSGPFHSLRTYCYSQTGIRMTGLRSQSAVRTFIHVTVQLPL